MNSRSLKQLDRTWGDTAFLAVQVVVFAAVIGMIVVSMRPSAHRKNAFPLRNAPLIVDPLYDDPSVVSDAQLRTVLSRLRPRLRGSQPKINNIDHALRFWGTESEFHDPDCLSGTEMRDLLTRHTCFTKVWGSDAKPLLVQNDRGVSVRTKEGNATASHVDHTLGGLAEVGTPLDFPLQTSSGPATMGDLVEASLRAFDLNQVEYEWSALAYALYLEPGSGWLASNGQQITFDMIADRVMREELGQGVCYGQHRLHALVIALRVDEQQSILSAPCRERVVQYLLEVVATLVRSQHSEGYWSGTWQSGVPPSPNDKPGRFPPKMGHLLATGHILEWLALAPKEVQPPREVVVRAGQWLCRTVIELEDVQVQDNYTFLTHVGRALALWRGHFPAHFSDFIENESRHNDPIAGEYQENPEGRT